MVSFGNKVQFGNASHFFTLGNFGMEHPASPDSAAAKSLLFMEMPLGKEVLTTSSGPNWKVKHFPQMTILLWHTL